MKKPLIELFPSFAIRLPDGEGAGRIRFQASGVVLGTRPKKIRRKLLVRLVGKLMDAGPELLQSELFKERTAPFFLPPKRTKVEFQIDGCPFCSVARTRRNGHFRLAVDDASGDWEKNAALLRARTPDGVTNSSTSIQILDSTGFSVISDIDDTIKFSDVENRAELLANTFLREFRPIEGMPEVYMRLAQQGVAFHYVTASPWQLNRPLTRFLAQHKYPPGSMHYRDFKVSDHLLKRLGIIHRRGKSARIRRILSSCPKREFILIGDSGERDAEIYARFYRDYPHLVRKIMIRLLEPGHQFRESILKARIALPERVFATFETSNELAELADELIENGLRRNNG